MVLGKGVCGQGKVEQEESKICLAVILVYSYSYKIINDKAR